MINVNPNKGVTRFRQILHDTIENSSIKKGKLKSNLRNYLEGYYQWFDSMEGHTRDQYILVCKTFISLVGEFIENVNGVNWNNFCNIMQKLNLLIEEKVTNIHNNSRRIREMFINFYTYISRNNPKEKERIKNIKHLLLNREVHYLVPYSHLRDSPYYYTNYPKGSNPHNIYQILIDDKEGRNPRFVNINFNTDNVSLIKLFKQFFLYCINDFDSNKLDFVSLKEKMNHSDMRAFIYYFEKSLTESLNGEEIVELRYDSKKINSLYFFNPSTFTKQYQFFKKLDREVNTASFSTSAILIKFYLFMDQQAMYDSGKSILDIGIFNIEFMFANKLLKHIELGYQIFVLNPFEPVPNSDYWCVIPKDKAKFTSEISKNNLYIDFTRVKNKIYRDDLKKYVWNYKNSQSVLKGAVPRLISFLNIFDEFQLDIAKVSLIHKTANFDDFLIKYRIWLKNQKTIQGDKIKDGTYMQTISQVKQYLRYYQLEYKIPEFSFELLKIRGIHYEGGTPFDIEDFIQIKQGFLKLRENAQNKEERIEAELFNIIFSLTCQTKLRQGEICNLKRDCILSVNEAIGVGEISYISKTSNGERVNTYLLLEDIQLIKKAIKLTEEYNSSGINDIKEYIFITKLSTKRMSSLRIGNIQAKYRLTFRKIIKSLYDSGLIKILYEPNDSRDTFIDNAWKQVESGNLTHLEAANLSGNTAKVAAQSYRKQLDTDYLEATYMITIGDIEIDGTIVESEKEIIELQQVGSGVGACNSKECVKKNEVLINSVDTDYLCMTCRKFVTCIERKDIFEERLEKYHIMESESESMIEKKYYGALVELYANYLTEILHFSNKKRYQ